MKKKDYIIQLQKDYINSIKEQVISFINQLPKNKIQSILLSGSVARGDYQPGYLGGKVDLTIMKKNGSSISADELFGPDEDPGIPFHCINWNGIGYQIAFHDPINCDYFIRLDESKKFALLESIILYDSDNEYLKNLELIKQINPVEQNNELNKCISYSEYLLSEYKRDRWFRRDAFLQLHENLNISIRLMIKCLFYINGKYAPAEDRRLYYSLSLEKIPNDYDELILKLNNQITNSESDYLQREKLFKETLAKFVEENRPTTVST